MIPQSVLIGIFVALVGYILQQRAWRNNLHQEIRQREFEECTRLVDALARAIDKRLTSMDHFYDLVKKGNVSEEDFKEYRDGVFSWMHEFSSFKSKIRHYFGYSDMMKFEKEVHSSIQKSSGILLRTNKFGIKKLRSSHVDEFKEFMARQGVVRRIAHGFLSELNQKVSNEKIGRTNLINNIHLGSLEHLSRSYLIQRLLGMKL